MTRYPPFYDYCTVYDPRTSYLLSPSPHAQEHGPSFRGVGVKSGGCVFGERRFSCLNEHDLRHLSPTQLDDPRSRAFRQEMDAENEENGDDS